MTLAEPQSRTQSQTKAPRRMDHGPSDDQLRQLAMEIIQLDPSLARQLEQSGRDRLNGQLA